MKAHMLQHVQSHASQMFRDVTNLLDLHLKRMRASAEEEMENAREELFAEIRRDYMNVIAGVQLSNEQMSRAEREMRAELFKKVVDVNKVFKKLVEPGWEDIVVKDGEEKDEKHEEQLTPDDQIEEVADDLVDGDFIGEPKTEPADQDLTMTDAVTVAETETDESVPKTDGVVPEPETIKAESGTRSENVNEHTGATSEDNVDVEA
jgi:hypothetical protein